MTITLHLLGRPSLWVGTVTHELERKSAAVLALLALEGEQARARLAAWLWADADGARNSLRQVLFKLPKGIVEGTDPLRLLADVRVDLRADLALEGELLGAFEYWDCPEFSDWLNLERERLALSRLESFALQSERLEVAGQFAPALELARRLVSLEPLSETHHRRVMRLCEATGDRAAAVRAFEDCRTVLRRELNLEPGLETQRLAVLVARGVRLPSVRHVRLEPPERLPDANREVTALLESARVLDSLGRAEAAFETLLAACAVLSEIEATDVLEQLVRQLEVRAGSDELIAKASQARAWLHFQRGEFVAAEGSAGRGLELTKDAELRSGLENELAAALLRQGRVIDALDWQRRAVDTLPPGSLEYAVALSELALSLANADEYLAAEGAYLEADALLEHFGATRHRITLLHNLAMTLKHQGRAGAALEPLEIASRLMAEIPGLIDDERYGYANRAEVLLQLEQFDEALELLTRAERLSLAHNLPYSFVHYRRAQVHLMLGEASAAERDLERATESAGVHARGRGFALLLGARVAALRGQSWQTALATAEAALTRTGSRAYLARAHLLRGAWSEPEAGFAIASRTVIEARELGMGGLEISALSALVKQGRLLGHDVEAELARAGELLETLEPLDFTRAEVLSRLQGQPHLPHAEDAASGLRD